jgi:hypothetical protein
MATMNNDIDVSKCKHYHHYYVIDDCKLEHYCDDSYLACGESDECCYRQLQWKIHECEAHQKAIERIGKQRLIDMIRSGV